MSYKTYMLQKLLSIKVLFCLNFVYINSSSLNKVFAENNSQMPTQEYLRNYSKDNFYIIGPGDVLYIQINEFTDELNNLFTVNGEGFLNLNGIRRIYVEGLTVDELSSLLNKEYLSLVKEPSVEISVIKYRPVKIFIDGEVEDTGLHILPGTYSLNGDIDKTIALPDSVRQSIFKGISGDISGSLNSKNSSSGENVFFPTVFDAIRKSNGITLNADLSNVKIIRKNSLSNGGGKITTTVNLLDTLNQKDNSQNIRLMDGDNIFISTSENNSLNQITKAIKSNLNPKFINVYVSGRVENIGLVQLNRTAALTDALDIVGPRVLKGPVRFLRYNYDGSVDSRKFAFRKKAKRGSYKNPILKNGDIIHITKSPLNVTTEVLSEITAPFQGILSSYTLYRAFRDL